MGNHSGHPPDKLLTGRRIPPGLQRRIAALGKYIGTESLALALGIAHQTVYRYKMKFPDLSDGREPANAKKRAELEKEITAVAEAIDLIRDGHIGQITGRDPWMDELIRKTAAERTRRRTEPTEH